MITTEVESPMMVVHLPSRHRIVQHGEVQTEASFVPSCIDLKYKYDALASSQFVQLMQLRRMVEECLQEVGRTVYDVTAFKDILFKLEDELPSRFPVTDMLLLSSKLFRKTAELARLLNCFFGVNFGDDNVDEHFHFAEVRILQRELAEVKQQLKNSENEKANLQQMLNNFGQMAVDHGKAVETLEMQNTALQLQTSALEDQMALLFHQLNTDLETSCKDAYDKVSKEMELQERLNPTRTTFRQTIDSISQQIRNSRSLITEVREALLTCTSTSTTGIGAKGISANTSGMGREGYGAIEPSIRFKLKTLDSNFQQLVSRFNAIKDTVVETAQEHMNALHERKKILYLSFQHIRLYDLQNAKLRHGKAILQEVLSHSSELLARMQVTFPAGAITSIDRVGRITSHRWQGGYTLAALRQSKQQQQQKQQQQNQQQQLSLSQSLISREAHVTSPTNNANSAALDVSEATMMAAESELQAFGANTRTNIPNSTKPEQTKPEALLSSPMPETSLLMTSTRSLQSTQLPLLPSSSQNVQSSSRLMSQSTSLALSPDVSSSSRFAISDGGLLPPSGIVEDDSENTAPPFDTMQELAEMVKRIANDAFKLNTSLTLEEEMAAFLRTLTLSVSSTPRVEVDGSRVYGDSNAGSSAFTAYAEGTLPMSIAQYENNFGNALLPTGSNGALTTRGPNDIHRAHLLGVMNDINNDDNINGVDNENDKYRTSGKEFTGVGGGGGGVAGILTSSRGIATNGKSNVCDGNADTMQMSGQRSPTSSRVTRSEQMKSEMMLSRQAQQIQRQQEQLTRLQDDFAAKVGFLRQVYEARIADLEIKESTLRQQFELSATNGSTVESGNSRRTSISGNNNTNNNNNNNSNNSNSAFASTTPSKATRNARLRKNTTRNSADANESKATRMQQQEHISSGVKNLTEKINARSDREELLLSRAEWRKTRETLRGQKPLREATIDELSKVGGRAQQKQHKRMSEAQNVNAIRNPSNSISIDSGSGRMNRSND